MTFLEAIASEEGYAVRGSTPNRPQRDLNPGDLMYGPEAVSFGAVGSDGRYAIFPDAATGWNALRRWFSIPARFVAGPVPGLFTDPNGTTLVGGYLGATIAQIIYRFAPPSDGNNTESYLLYVCEQTGLTRETILTQDMLELPQGVV